MLKKIYESQLIVNTMNHLAKDIHEWAKSKGFWDEDRNDGECIALMHAELSEALEGIRAGDPPDNHCPEHKNVVIEFADCIIRILDTCAARNYPIGEALSSKMKYNENRPHKHGKKF